MAAAMTVSPQLSRRAIVAAGVMAPTSCRAASLAYRSPLVDDKQESWFSSEFVTYFAKILLNYDDECREWWKERETESALEEFAASLNFGLSSYSRDALVFKYGSDPETRRQIAIALTFLDPQPSELIEKLLRNSASPQVSNPPLFSNAVKKPNGSFVVFQQSPARTERVYKEIVTMDTYKKFALAGAFGCSLTHSLLVPLDVLKTRLQTTTTATDTEQQWSLGLVPTVLGYSWYGATVYPGFEYFRRYLEGVMEGRIAVALLAGALATCVACVGACPAEAARIRIVAEPEIYRRHPLRTIVERDGIGAFYDGFAPLLTRQIIFGSVKFAFFDGFSEKIVQFAPQLSDDTISSRVLVATISGLAAGSFASLTSQPADALLSKLNAPRRPPLLLALRELVDENGFFKGAIERCAWAALVISGQFALYDLFKSYAGVSQTDLVKVLDITL